MNWFLDLRLANKLLLGFMVVLSSVIGLGVFSLEQMARIKGTTAALEDQQMPRVRALSELTASAGNVRLAELQHVLASGPSEKRRQEQALAVAVKQLAAAQSTYSRLIGTEAGDPAWRAWLDDWGAYLERQRKVLESSSNGFSEQAKDLSNQASQPTFEAARLQLGKLMDANLVRLQQASALGEAAYRRARVVIGAALVAVIAVGLVISLLLARIVVRPIDAAMRLAQRAASGDLSFRQDDGGRRDEAGLLVHALAEMNTGLGRVVMGVRESADRLAETSSALAGSSAELNRRSELQATTLQNAAAEMEQLARLARDNGDAARDAAALSEAACRVASDGAKAVGEVTGTMQRIEASSRRIADITGVIDGIAFQTNILALNASVEAARAGEHGSGFSVVAQEVRSLSQRSAAAAQEIKDLIAASTQFVDSGIELVRVAGETMAQLEGKIRHVSELVGRVGSATADQVASIEQISVTVTELDQATQAGLGLVQDTFHAADVLKDHSSHLVRVVQAFQLAE